jgi:hypothetical protein
LTKNIAAALPDRENARSLELLHAEPGHESYCDNDHMAALGKKTS